MPATGSVIVACTWSVPGPAEARSREQEPFPAVVVHEVVTEFEPVKTAPLASWLRIKLIVVPSGALTAPLPSPALMSTWAVSVTVVPGEADDACGVIWMLASTHV